MLLFVMLALRTPVLAEDEFCSPGAVPPFALAASPAACCTEKSCTCNSKICGGDNVLIQDEISAPPPLSDRMPVVRSAKAAPNPGHTKPVERYRQGTGQLPEPPAPPPPRGSDPLPKHHT